jgi:transcription antitermination factor NusG
MNPSMSVRTEMQTEMQPRTQSALAAWYAVQTRPRHEQTVVTQLNQDGLETLLPMVHQVRKWTDRRKLVHVPLFPSYVFVRTTLSCNEERVRILRKSGVVSFVGPRREAEPIANSNVRALLTSEVEYGPHPYLTVGQRVRIRSGALRGLEGILLRVGGGDNLVLSVDLIHKSVILHIDGYDLEPA